MALCLNYQSVYCRRESIVISVRMQIFAASILLIALVAKVWIKIESTDIGYQLAKERQMRIAYDMERRELELQRSVLLRTDNLTEAARDRLGLQPLNPKQARRIVVHAQLQEV